MKNISIKEKLAGFTVQFSFVQLDILLRIVRLTCKSTVQPKLTNIFVLPKLF